MIIIILIFSFSFSETSVQKACPRRLL